MDRVVLDAAVRLLDARASLMLTAEQWDSIEHAVREATQPKDADVSFELRGDELVQVIRPRHRGAAVVRTCEGETFRHLVEVLDEFECFSIEDARARTDRAWSEVAVAIAFLVSQGAVRELDNRRFAAAVEDEGFERAVRAWATLKAAATPTPGSGPGSGPGGA